MSLEHWLINENVGLYFFSAVFQGNMALVALTAIFVIFKIQDLNKKLDTNEQVIKDFIRQSFRSISMYHHPMEDPPLSYKKIEELPSQIEILKKSGKYQGIKDEAKSLLEDDKNFNARFEERF